MYIWGRLYEGRLKGYKTTDMNLTIKKNRPYFIYILKFNLGYTDQRTILRSLKKSLSAG